MNAKTQPKKLVEESPEAKIRQHNRYVEETTAKDELKGLWEAMISNTKRDALDSLPSSFGNQIFGELVAGQEVALDKKPQQEEPQEKKQQPSMEHLEYFRTVQNIDRAPETRTEQQVTQAVEQIRIEIKKLISTSKLVERTVKDATAEKAPVKPGRYHLNFFEFVLNVLKEATRKLEDSATFGAIFTSKKQQSKYWNSYKKHGTSFGLSGERTTATQTG